MKLITSEKSGYRWVSSKHSFKNTILTFTNSVPSSFEIEMCSEVTCKVPLLIAGHILKFPCHIITRVFLYFYNLRTVFSDQRTFFTMIIFSFVVWHDSDSCAIITFIYFWTDSPNRLYTLWIQGKCLMFKVELILEQHGFGLHESIYPWISSVICVTVPHDLQLIEFMGPVP